MSERSMRSSKSSKNKPKAAIAYRSQRKVSKWIKEASAFARWCEKEEFGLSKGLLEGDPDKAYKLFEQERARKKSSLWALQHDAREEKRKRVLLRPGLDSAHGRQRAWKAEQGFPILLGQGATTLFKEHEISPTKTLLYSGSPASTSFLIYPCPDLRQWSAWFDDDEVTLNQGYRYWFPDKMPPFILPNGPNLIFSGRFIIDTRFTLQGVVDIGRYGSVTVDIATYVTVVECNADDKNHDNGWHYDPNYDRIIVTWSSYCNCDQIQQRYYSDTQQGLHTFAHYIEQPVHFSCCCGAPNRFVEVTHLLTLTAINATCQFGPNRTDCLAGSSAGWINSYWPMIQLEFV